MPDKENLHLLLNQQKPVLMGIINLTDDSFYDAGVSFQHLASQIAEFESAGVDIIDVGAESSRPGALPISTDIEIERLEKALGYIKQHSSAYISVDTYKPETAQFSLENGVHIINDISGGESEEMLHIVSRNNAGIVLMHKKGTPKNMQDNPQYDDAIFEIKTYLTNQIKQARNAGIKTIMIDPGIGFGKTLDHNLTILRQLNELEELGCPILIGTSNKSFIGQLTGANINERIPGSIASVLAAYQKGARIFRVHNVKETAQAFTVFEAVL